MYRFGSRQSYWQKTVVDVVGIVVVEAIEKVSGTRPPDVVPEVFVVVTASAAVVGICMFDKVTGTRPPFVVEVVVIVVDKAIDKVTFTRPHFVVPKDCCCYCCNNCCC